MTQDAAAMSAPSAGSHGPPTDIVERLLRWVDRETVENDPAGAITAAAAEIVKLRHDIMELACAVRTAGRRKDAVEVANRLSPINVNAVLLNGFYRVDMAWRNMEGKR
jgi:hypothetical protein